MINRSKTANTYETLQNHDRLITNIQQMPHKSVNYLKNITCPSPGHFMKEPLKCYHSNQKPGIKKSTANHHPSVVVQKLIIRFKNKKLL